MGPRGVPWPSRGVPWPLYEEYVLELSYYLYYSLYAWFNIFAIATLPYGIALYGRRAFCALSEGSIRYLMIGNHIASESAPAPFERWSPS